MKFKLVENINESKVGNENRKLFNMTAKKAKEYFLSLPEADMLKELDNGKNQENITNHSSMFITGNGHILNATYYENKFFNRDEQVHLDIFYTKFIDKMREYLTGTPAEHLLDIPSSFEKLITKLFNITHYCMNKFNWIKLNSGTITDENNCYITFGSSIPSYSQKEVINDYLWSIYEWGHKSVQIWGETSNAKYQLESPKDVDYVIDRIESYCRTGKIREDLDKIV